MKREAKFGSENLTIPAMVEVVQNGLSKRSNPGRAGPMAAYMKTVMPFYGVEKRGRVEVFRGVRTSFVPKNFDEYNEAVLALWSLPHREEKYLAITLARTYPDFIGLPSLPLYERMIREGAWWDLVDEPAIHLVGQVYLDAEPKMGAILNRWIDDPDLWIRRTAILAQISHKEWTDSKRLFRYCLRRASETEFFIRKAIGWALREYAKTAPHEVANFLRKNRPALSGLSFREAAKGVTRAGVKLYPNFAS